MSNERPILFNAPLIHRGLVSVAHKNRILTVKALPPPSPPRPLRGPASVPQGEPMTDLLRLAAKDRPVHGPSERSMMTHLYGQEAVDTVFGAQT